MIIDVHAHAIPQAMLEHLRDHGGGPVPVRQDSEGRYWAGAHYELEPPLYTLDLRLADLERRGIDLQLVTPPPPTLAFGDYALGAEAARGLNAQMASLRKLSGGRVEALASAPLGSPDVLVAELERTIGEHGFRGVGLPTIGANGTPLDHEQFAPMWRFIEERKLLVFIHPTTAVSPKSSAQFTLETVVTWPTETSYAVGRMIASGLIERHPDLRIVLAHGGGTLPFLAGRMDRAYHAPHHERNPELHKYITRPPSSYLSSFYLDTVLLSPQSLRFVLEFAGADKVVFGSDYPFEIGDAEGEIALPTLNALAAAQKAAVMGGTIGRLLSEVG